MCCRFSLQRLKLTAKLTTTAKVQVKTMAAIGVKKNPASGLHGNRAVALITVFLAVCNREVFRRAPFIVQITNGAFMPPDKWQMIIDPDSTETTHLSNRYTHHKHTVDVSVCVCVLQRCSSVSAVIGSCHIGRK